MLLPALLGSIGRSALAGGKGRECWAYTSRTLKIWLCRLGICASISRGAMKSARLAIKVVGLLLRPCCSSIGFIS